MTEWLLARLREPSSWRGIIWLLTAMGVTLSPEAWEYVVAAGMALAGLLGVFLADPDPDPSLPPIVLVGRATDPAPADPGTAGAGDARPGAGAGRLAGELRVQADRRSSQAGAADGHALDGPVGFGDRD